MAAEDVMSRRAARTPSQRQLRVGEELRHALATVLERDLLRDPVLEDVILTVTEVRASPDLRRATVYVTRLGGDTDEELLEALDRARPFLRRQVALAVTLRHVPDLEFVADRSFEQAGHIDALLQEPGVAADLAPAPDDGEDDGA
jgi:ribosome-binding factor A